MWPAPEKACTVVPPIRLAATPVLATTAVSSGGRIPIILRMRYDFPVPAPPVQKTLMPRLTRSMTSACSVFPVLATLFRLLHADVTWLKVFSASKVGGGGTQKPPRSLLPDLRIGVELRVRAGLEPSNGRFPEKGNKIRNLFDETNL